MREMMLEILASMRGNKLRTFLTGFSVAWGIFMLVILLGSGNGLRNGILSNLGGMAVNSISVNGGWTSMPYMGYAKDRRIRLTNRDVELLQAEFSEVEEVAAIGYYASGRLTYGEEFLNAQLTGALPSIERIQGVEMARGRFINRQDIQYRRKVIVIDQTAREVLFHEEEPLGREVKVAGGLYRVVGVYRTGRQWGNTSRCYIPLTTGQLVYKADDPAIHRIEMTVRNLEDKASMEDFERQLRQRFAVEHHFNPTDDNALWVNNRFEEYRELMSVFRNIRLFIWIIGLGTLMAGIVGVGNIMLVTVRERTYEFGIRKALGARPYSIVRLILTESVFVTAFFGYVGMVAGIGVMEGVAAYLDRMKESGETLTVFLDPTVDLGIALSATLTLVLAGLVAGYIPARRAARLKTIDALRFNR